MRFDQGNYAKELHGFPEARINVLKVVVGSLCVLDMAKPMQGRGASYEERNHERVSELDEEKSRLELGLLGEGSKKDEQELDEELQHAEDALSGSNRKLLANSDRLQCAS